MIYFDETLYKSWHQSFRIDRVLYRDKTDYQDLVIFQTPEFGRVLALDGIVQLTEADEHIYHEMLAHVPVLAHGGVSDVLIIGGGDGGVLREVLKHPVKSATLVEIDRGVIDLCREHMPSVSDGAYDDPRTEVIITDGVKFVAETDRRFDVIVVDSTDPVGPGKVLFTQEFYRSCQRCLKPGGILVTQNGVPFTQADELRETHRDRRAIFKDASFFVAAVPTYVGGFMALGWGSDEPAHRAQGADVIRPRFEAAGLRTRYYTPELHVGSFALPQYILDLMD